MQDLFQLGSICVNDQLIAAISLLELPTLLSQRFEDNIFGYIQLFNWIMSHFGPEVVFKWQCNIWQEGTTYGTYQNPNQTHITSKERVADFIDEIKAYKGNYQLGFIVFDKYEREDFNPDALSTNT